MLMWHCCPRVWLEQECSVVVILCESRQGVVIVRRATLVLMSGLLDGIDSRVGDGGEGSGRPGAALTCRNRGRVFCNLFWSTKVFVSLNLCRCPRYAVISKLGFY